MLLELKGVTAGYGGGAEFALALASSRSRGRGRGARLPAGCRPVAIRVIFTSGRALGTMTAPKIMFASGSTMSGPCGIVNGGDTIEVWKRHHPGYQ